MSSQGVAGSQSEGRGLRRCAQRPAPPSVRPREGALEGGGGVEAPRQPSPGSEAEVDRGDLANNGERKDSLISGDDPADHLFGKKFNLDTHLLSEWIIK